MSVHFPNSHASPHADGRPRTPYPVLIVDDSAVTRALLTRYIDQTDEFRVAQAVGNVAAALETLAAEQFAIILLDVEMPGIDGLTALPDLLVAGKGAKIIVVSSRATEGAVVAIQAMALGAADTLPKPTSGLATREFGVALIDKLRRLTGQDVVALPVQRARQTALIPPAALTPKSFDMIAIGASTGGIYALTMLFRALPTSFDVPILITQHLPTSFMPYFATQLALLSGRPCDVAVDRMRIQSGRIFLAPGDAHMRCVALPDGGAAIRLSTEPASSGCLPSVDPMFASLAMVYGPRLLAVVLSGMGRDGAEAATLVRNAGGCVIVQDEESSVVWGMPGAVVASGAAVAALAPEALGKFIASGNRA